MMFCDLVGSTPMSKLLDPEDLGEVLSAYQEVCKRHVTRYDGYIARYMGDGILVYFGYPAAHERDPERAVRAGLDIVADVGAMSLPGGMPLLARVGIATGRVVVGDLIGEGASEERTVLGETPNLAARLQAMAEPGTVCVSETTYALLSEDLNFECLGPQSLRGISDPVLAYRALGERSAQTRSVGYAKTPFVGRQEQLEILKQQWRRAKTGLGKIVTLLGEPGFGKSRLIAEFKAEAADTPHGILELKSSEFHQHSSFWPLRLMFEQTLNKYDSRFASHPTEVLNQWLLPFASLGDDTALILHHLLNRPDGPVDQQLDGAALKIRTVELLADLFAALASELPLLVIIEDAQWLDASTTEFLNRLVARIASVPCLLLIAARPEFLPQWNQNLDIVSLGIERFDPDQANELINRIAAGKKLPDGIRQTLLEHADGIPLYIEELTRSVVESEHSTHRGLNPAELLVPTSLQDSLMARLDRLGSAKMIAQKAAVIGRIFDHRLLQAISGIDASNTEHGILQLLNRDILIPRSDIGEGLFEFRHALIRDIAYQSLLIRRRKLIHAEVAASLLELNPSIGDTEPEALAYHYREADLPEKALGFWKNAGDKAKSRWANIEAIAHYHMALMALAEAFPGDFLQEVDLLLDQAESMRNVDRYGEAFSALGRAESLATNNGFAPQLIRTYYQLGNLSFVTGDFDQCVSLNTKVRDLARTSGAVGDEARAESGLGDAGLFSGRIQTAERHYDTCMKIAHRENLSEIGLANLPLRGHMRIYLNQFSAAISDCREAVKLAIIAGNRRVEMVARGSCLAKVLYELGQWPEADEQLICALEIAKSLGARRYVPMYLCFRAKIALARADAKSALELASTAVELNRQGDLLFAAPMALGTLARTVSSHQEMTTLLSEAEAMLKQGSMSQNHFWFRLDAMELGLTRGDAAMVDHHAHAFRSYIKAEPPAWAEFHIQRCSLLAKVAAGQRNKAVESEMLKLLDESRQRDQKPAAASLETAL